MTVRMGHIRFLNCFPMYCGLEQRGHLSDDGPVDQPDRPGIELVPGVPTELNRWLVAGRIDLGLISSIAYARNHRRLLISRRLSISSLGAVDSIQLVTRMPVEKIRSVALTAQSATSVALLKTLFKLRLRQEVAYCELQGPVAQALEDYDAVLVIGDQGLEALYFPEAGAACHDLGALWTDWTGLPMVYAVWATREDFARSHGDELAAVEQELVRCVEYGRQHVPEVVKAALGRYRFDRESLTRYFGLLHYGFGEEYQKGLRRFYELAYQAGELEEMPRMRFVDEAAGVAEAVAAEAGGAGATDAPPGAGTGPS